MSDRKEALEDFNISIKQEVQVYDHNDGYHDEDIENYFNPDTITEIQKSLQQADYKVICNEMAEALKTCSEYDHGMAGCGQEYDEHAVYDVLKKYEAMKGE